MKWQKYNWCKELFFIDLMMNVYFWGPKFVNAIHVQINDVHWINQRIDRLLKDFSAFNLNFPGSVSSHSSR